MEKEVLYCSNVISTTVNWIYYIKEDMFEFILEQTYDV